MAAGGFAGAGPDCGYDSEVDDQKAPWIRGRTVFVIALLIRWRLNAELRYRFYITYH